MELLSLSLIGISIVLAIFVLLMENERKASRNIQIRQKKIIKKDVKTLKLYEILVRIPLLQALPKRALSIINKSSEIRARHKRSAVEITLKALFLFLCASILVSPFVSNIRIFITAGIGIVFMTISTVDYFSGKINTQLLSHLVDFLDILRNKYYECGNRVDDALSETIQSLDLDRHHDIIDEAELLLETIEDPDHELSLRDYYQIAPNKYFVLLAGLLFINKENGDLIDEKGSRFAKSLTDLGAELKEEIHLRDRLNFSLKSLNVIAILPIFVLSPLRIWASESFYPLKKFYDSSSGFYIEFLVLLSVIFSFICINKIQSFKDDLSEQGEYEILNKFYKRYAHIIDFLLPKKDSLRYRRVKKRQEEALDFSRMDLHYVKKFLFMLSVFFLSVLVTLYVSHISKKAILENPTLPESYLGGELSKKEKEYAVERTKMDTYLLTLLFEGKSSKELIRILEEKYGLYGEERNLNLERIIKKYKDYEANKFNYKDVLFIYVLSLIAYCVPEVLLLIRRRMIKIDAMNEITKFQLIISLLVHIKEIGIDHLLEWMEKFSVIYKIPLQEAIMDYDAGAERALQRLKACSQNDDFIKLIEHMLSAVNSISIEQAFEDLESEKNYYAEKRRVIYQRIVDKKISLGKIIGFLPSYSVILIYFMFPLIYSSTQEIDLYFKMFTM